MGRKKGKQSGAFGSKLKRSAFYSEIIQQQYEERPSKDQTKRTKQPGPSATNNSSMPCRPRCGVNLNQLRGLIRERILEDRLLDANERRARLLSRYSNVSSLHQQKEGSAFQSRVPEELSLQNETQMIRAGWLLTYDHRAAMAGVESHSLQMQSQKPKQFFPTLKSLSIHVLASVMREYVDACGVEYMHSRLAELPGHVISDLSSKCQDVTDDIAYILGHHSQVDRLVLHGMEDIYRASILDEEICCNKKVQFLTTQGLVCMMKNDHTDDSNNDGCGYACTDIPDGQLIDSWETLSLHDEKRDSHSSIKLHCPITDTCGFQNLHRLELRNFHATDSSEFLRFLSKCSNLTHLSLAKSLNFATGPNILLLQDSDDIGIQNGTRILLDVLPKLQVLDLHGCHWLHLDLLKKFLNRIRLGRYCLELICIGGCSTYISKECQSLNAYTSHKPYLCIVPP